MSLDLHVISWNLFHGQDGGRLGPTIASTLRRRPITDGERLHLNRKWIDEMAAVIHARRPCFAALQEVPPQAVARLAEATGMRAVHAVMRPLLGPLGWRGRLADRNPDLWRTHEGTANVVLAAPEWVPLGHWTLRHNPPLFAARHGHRLRIGLRERIHWILEPRRLVTGRFRHTSGAIVNVASLHCHNSLVWDVIAAEVARVVPQLLARVPHDEPLIVAGDFNAAGRRHPALTTMLDAGFDEDSLDDLVIDHIFQRGLRTVRAPHTLDSGLRELAVPFDDATRTVLLSDHDLVAATFSLPHPGAARAPDR